MRAIRRDALIETVVAGAVFAVLLLILMGCSEPSPQVKAGAAEAAYKAEHMQCVEANDTRETIDACRADVDRRWHVDGGAR